MTQPQGATPYLRVLQDVFGYTSFRGQQREIIETVGRGQSAVVLMPTGGGKSLCYQVPAIAHPGTALVVSPLISLMKDQVDTLQSAGVRAAFLNSTQDFDEQRDVIAALRSGTLDLLYVSPERANQAGFVSLLRQAQLNLIAIDEAHCVSQWGHDFRPEYARLTQLREAFPETPCLALTATADAHTRDDIRAVLQLERSEMFISSFDRPNIRYVITPKQSAKQQLKKLIAQRKGESGIVYCLSRRNVEEIASVLEGAGHRARAYHAGLEAEERAEVQEAFLRDEVEIVVATVAFGMGIDKPDVRFVIHYDMPKNIEGYYQETGRAGRDGLPADAICLYGNQDIAFARKLIDLNENAEQRRIEGQKLQAMVGLVTSLTCRRQVLLSYFGETSEPCHNCDVCESPPQTFEATTLARQFLSCVYRVGESYGMNYVVDILRGADTDAIRSRGHKALSTYGIGEAFPKALWNAVGYQLLHRGYVYQDFSHYGVLKLSDQARPLLRGEESITLAKPRIGSRNGHRRKQFSVADDVLFEKLRQVRRRLAEERDVPAYVVCNDATLADMCERQPTSRVEMLRVSGIGAHKMRQFGEAFIDAVRSHLAS